jgi:large subunit ribosomal protein L18
MAKGPQYNLPFRRRREGRTNYGKRRKLVTSGMTRLVVRPSNRHIAAQLVRAQADGDRILASAHSSQLKEFGWKAPCGNLPAAYLTGLLAGQRAKASGVSEAILDIGLHSKGLGSRLFAVAKGAVEAGLNVPHDEKAFTSKERVQGKHVVDYSKKLSSDTERYKKIFSTYLKQKLKPEDLSTHFEQVQAKIKGKTEAPAN